MTKVLVVTLAGPTNTYEDHYPIDTPFRWQGDKLELFNKGSPVPRCQYNMTYVISLAVEDRELDSKASAEAKAVTCPYCNSVNVIQDEGRWVCQSCNQSC